MRNNKGFTLMELVAAIFIGGMVTAALVLVWRVSSVQTSQNQRQTIIRNQLSNFQRQLYKDFYESDVITYPPTNTSGTTMILAGIKNTNDLDLNSKTFSSDGHAEAFYYCIANNDSTTLKRYVESITTPSTYNIINYNQNKLTDCQNNGTVVLNNFTITNSSISGPLYTLQGIVQKTFNIAAGSTPINITIDEQLLIPGGFL